MSTEIETTETVRFDGETWRNGAIGGILGSIAFGAVMHAVGAVGILAVAIPALYGIAGPNLLAGWVVHLGHGAVLGVVYAGVVSATPLREYGRRAASGVALGVGYGVVADVALAAILMPIWLRVVGFPNAPPLPNVTVPVLGFHLAYGVVLGGVYAGLSD